MFLSVKEICFFCLIFVVTTITLIGFNQTFSKFKSVSPIVSSYIVSFLITIVLLSVYKLTNIQDKEKEGFHFELSKSKKCQGYPYMHSSNPELLKECAEELSKLGDPNLKHFEYTPDSNQYWENERCGQQKPNPVNSCRQGVNFIQYSSPTGEKSSEHFQENFNGSAESDLLTSEKRVCAFGPSFVQYECPDGIKFFDSVTSGPSGPNSSQNVGISGPSGPNCATVGQFDASKSDILSHQYNLSFYQPLRVKNKFNEKGITYAFLSTNSYGSRNKRPILY